MISIVKVAPIYLADAQGVFDEAALMAVRKFKYKPKISEGEAVTAHGIRDKVAFARAD